jgi:bacterioferritin-associated ferredoxin
MGKTILCHCEDVDVEEVYSAHKQGFGDLETLRRYTGVGTGKCQGKCCIVQTLRVLASIESERSGGDSGHAQPSLTGDPSRLHLPTARPPVLPMRVDDIIEARKEDE